MGVLAEYRPRLDPLTIQTEKQSQLPHLAREVIRINASSPEERRVYDLEGTGFHVGTQARLLRDNYKVGISLVESAQQLRQDINGFNIEYLKEAPVFAIPLSKKKINGEERIVGRLYGEKIWEDTADEIEREGVVKESVRKMSKALVTAKPGTLLVFHSGEGWSNYQDKNGRLEPLNENDVRNGVAQRIVYPDTQTYTGYVNPDGTITAVTLRADMDISQSERFLALLKGQGYVSKDYLTEKERIKQVVGNVLEFNPDKGVNIESIVKAIQKIKGEGNVAYVDSLGRERTFDEMRFMLRNPQNLEKVDEITERLVSNVMDYAQWRMSFDDDNVQKDLEVALGYTVLNLMHEIRGSAAQIPEAIISRSQAGLDPHIIPFDPRKMLEELQKLPGCAGGGLKVESAMGPRTGAFAESDKHGPLEFECPDCKRVNKRPKGVLLDRCQYMDCMSTNVCAPKSPVSFEEAKKKKEDKTQNKPQKKAA